MSLFSSATSSAPAPGNTGPGSSSPLVPFSIEMIKENVPTQFRSNINQQFVDNINNISTDPLIAEYIRDNFISYTAVLKEGKFKIEEYLNAVAFVSYKVMGHTNKEAYGKVFPIRMNALIAAGRSDKEISSYVSAYNKGKLVNMILEQTLVPSWVLNQDLHQKAINKLADLMISAQSEKVQAEAAIGLIAALGKPKEGNFQINIGETENAGMKEMRAMLEEVARNQRNAISSGAMKTIDVAAQRIRNEDDD